MIEVNPLFFFPLSPMVPIFHFPPLRIRREKETIIEIKSNNNNFMDEKNIDYSLYPLYINWKDLENHNRNNSFYKVFKSFGYFGVAIFTILYNCNLFPEKPTSFTTYLADLYFVYEKKINSKDFFEKLTNIYDDVVSLIKNKIIIFKETTVFILVLKLYEQYFLSKNENDKVLDVLKYEFLLMKYLTDVDYKKIYNKFFSKFIIAFKIDDENNGLFIKTKKKFINKIKETYKEINNKDKISEKKEN